MWSVRVASAADTARVSTTPIGTRIHTGRREISAADSVFMLARVVPTPSESWSIGRVARAAHGTTARGQPGRGARSRVIQRGRGSAGRRAGELDAVGGVVP